LSNVVLYGGTSILHLLVRHGDAEGSDYATQIHHAASNTINSSTPGAAFLFMAVRSGKVSYAHASLNPLAGLL
jgi:hypothetical protein